MSMGRVVVIGAGVGLLAILALWWVGTHAQPEVAADAAQGAAIVSGAAKDGAESAFRAAAEVSSAVDDPAGNRKAALTGAVRVANESVEGAQRVTGAVREISSGVRLGPDGAKAEAGASEAPGVPEADPERGAEDGPPAAVPEDPAR